MTKSLQISFEQWNTWGFVTLAQIWFCPEVCLCFCGDKASDDELSKFPSVSEPDDDAVSSSSSMREDDRSKLADMVVCFWILGNRGHLIGSWQDWWRTGRTSRAKKWRKIIRTIGPIRVAIKKRWSMQSRTMIFNSLNLISLCQLRVVGNFCCCFYSPFFVAIYIERRNKEKCTILFLYEVWFFHQLIDIPFSFSIYVSIIKVFPWWWVKAGDKNNKFRLKHHVSNIRTLCNMGCNIIFYSSNMSLSSITHAHK